MQLLFIWDTHTHTNKLTHLSPSVHRNLFELLLFKCLFSVWFRCYLFSKERSRGTLAGYQWTKLKKNNNRVLIKVWLFWASDERGRLWLCSHTTNQCSITFCCKIGQHSEVMSFTCWGRVWSQVRGRLLDEWPRPKHAPPFDRASHSPCWCISHVHTAVGGAKADLWTCTTEPAPIQTHKKCVRQIDLSGFIPFCGQGRRILRFVCWCVPALLFWGAVWSVGWSGLGGGVLPLFSGLHALDLQFLNSNNNNKKKEKSVFHKTVRQHST